MLRRSALYDLGSARGQGPRRHLDGRGHARAGRPAQAQGASDGERCSRCRRLLWSRRAREPWRLMGGELKWSPAVTRVWWLVDAVSLMLESDERDAVRGDFAESNETAA